MSSPTVVTGDDSYASTGEAASNKGLDLTGDNDIDVVLAPAHEIFNDLDRCSDAPLHKSSVCLQLVISIMSPMPLVRISLVFMLSCCLSLLTQCSAFTGRMYRETYYFR